jgi:hypothetical protein
MRLIMASLRGHFSGWLLAFTIPLISDTATINAWSNAGLQDEARIGLAMAELFGAALFAFEPLIFTGVVLLLASFAAAAAVHIHNDNAPWHLAVYALVVTLLLYCTKRRQRKDADAPRQHEASG